MHADPKSRVDNIGLPPVTASIYPALPPDTDCHLHTVNGTFRYLSHTHRFLVKSLVLLNFRPAICYSCFLDSLLLSNSYSVTQYWSQSQLP